MLKIKKLETVSQEVVKARMFKHVLQVTASPDISAGIRPRLKVKGQG